MLQLLDEGQRTSTYKFAVLLALIDLCVEVGTPAAGEIAISTRRLAERVLELYWPQTTEYQGERRRVVLVQNTKGQAEIISEIRAFRGRAGADPSEPLHRARLRDPKGFERLVTIVEWKLIEMPLPKLQRINNTMIELLYRIGWDDQISRRVAYGDGFDRRIYLRPGVREHLLRLSGLLRPLVQQAWAGMVVKMNRDATDEARLMEFLFGSRRIALGPIQRDLRELQDNRCFYCAQRIQGVADVDHFIPWVRHPDNGIENLVLADSRCNNSKRDFLAAGEHVERWAARFRDEGSLSRALADIATRSGWESHSDRTLHTARSIYARLPDDVGLWLDRDAMVAVAGERETLTRALGLASS
jgi:5-methylcytosine-specific restriction endonuclease McrA